MPKPSLVCLRSSLYDSMLASEQACIFVRGVGVNITQKLNMKFQSFRSTRNWKDHRNSIRVSRRTTGPKQSTESKKECHEQYYCRFLGHETLTISPLHYTHFWKFMPNSTQSICPICGGETHEIRAKLHCRQCGMILETCCEGGPMHARSCDQQTIFPVPSKNSKDSKPD
jgi:hypothetical protein